MESRFIEQSKENYSKMLLANGSLERSKEIAALDAYAPMYKFRPAHDQAEPSAKDLNEMINESYLDIEALIIGFRDAGKNFHELMLNTDAKLKRIKHQLLIEKEKLDDLNILCNQYSDFNTVINLDDSNLMGNFSYDNGIIAAQVQSHDPVTYTITSIEGNGYEGNDYVYKANKFLKESIDTSSRRFINDNNVLTVYEYSRITASNSEKEVFPNVNFDSVEAKLTISITSINEFNKIKMQVSSKDTFLTGILTSTDGISYKNVLKQPIEMNNDTLKYEQINYIASSGMFCFPSTKYLKLVLESNGTTDDILAFEKVSVISTEPKTPEPVKKALSQTVFARDIRPTPFLSAHDEPEERIMLKQTKRPVLSDERYIYNRTRQELMRHVMQLEE